jgi:hypothetical protein
MCDFGFRFDVVGHLNELDCHLQGKDQLIHTLHSSIKVFQTKLILWECQLKANNYSHIPTLAEVNGSGAHNSEKYSNCIRTLIEEFNDRFSDFKAREILIRMFSSPFFLVEMEFADFQSDSTLKDSSVSCYLLISIQNMFLPQNILKSENMLCEQLFSLMNMKSRSRMSH